MRAIKVYSGWVEVEPVINMRMWALCVKPYPGHLKGCPNYNKKNGCPPRAPKIFDVLDLSKPVFAIYNIFDFGRHCNWMRRLHPMWTRRQVECCLYWQQTARKQLKAVTHQFLWAYPTLTVLDVPEACGINITETMGAVGIELEWQPVNWTYQIVLAGTGKNIPLTFEDLIE